MGQQNTSSEDIRHDENFEELKRVLANGTFHHATYRNRGTVWEGLWVYLKDPDGFRGYAVGFNISKDSPHIDVAHDLCRGTGISVGSYGCG